MLRVTVTGLAILLELRLELSGNISPIGLVFSVQLLVSILDLSDLHLILFYFILRFGVVPFVFVFNLLH